MNKECSNCLHNEICKYVEKVDDKIKNANMDDDIFELKCKHKLEAPIYSYPLTRDFPSTERTTPWEYPTITYYTDGQINNYEIKG